MLVLGGSLAVVAAFLSGTSGFGFALLATPMLLVSGFSLPFAVTANFLISVATRISVAWRLRSSIHWRRVAMLVGGAIPGLWLGSRLLGAIDGKTIKVVVGAVIVAAVAALAIAERHPPQPRIRGLNVVVGFLGGLLGTTTSLTGVPPALLLARRRLAQPTFFADLAVYFIATAGVGLVVLALDGHFSRSGASAAVWWLPGVLVANAIGTTLGLRLPARAFRSVTLAFAFVAGIVTIASA